MKLPHSWRSCFFYSLCSVPATIWAWFVGRKWQLSWIPWLQDSHGILSIGHPRMELILLEGNTEQNREMGKEHLLGQPGREPWLCLAGSVGRLEKLLQPAHPQMTSATVFSFFLCHSDCPFGSHRVLGAASDCHGQEPDLKIIGCKL